MTTDLRTVPVSTSERGALEAYETALRQYQSYVGDPIATIDRALAEHPEFVLGHIFRAGVLMTFGEQRFAHEARASVAAAERLAPRANDRERGLVAAVRKLVDGDWHGACAAFDRVLIDHPRDAFAIQTAHLFDFYRGDAKNLRDRVTRVLPAWNASVPGYSFILGMHAFGLEECNEYDDALATAQKALALEPRDGWSVHAAVHVMEMQGRTDEGIEVLESRQADWAPDSGFAFHLYWHLALFHLDRGDFASAIQVFDTAIYPGDSDISLTLVDATSLLWRLQLFGADVRSRFARVAEVWARKLDAERGFYAFNDVHAVLAFAGAGDEARLRQLAGDLESAATGTSNAEMVRAVGMPVARAITAFANERYADAMTELEAVRDRAHVFGGSHAQRDLLTLTLVESALRSGNKNVARHYLAERTVLRRASKLGWRLLERAVA